MNQKKAARAGSAARSLIVFDRRTLVRTLVGQRDNGEVKHEKGTESRRDVLKIARRFNAGWATNKANHVPQGG
jgi:hypothetical protein